MMINDLGVCDVYEFFLQKDLATSSDVYNVRSFIDLFP